MAKLGLVFRIHSFTYKNVGKKDGEIRLFTDGSLLYRVCAVLVLGGEEK